MAQHCPATSVPDGTEPSPEAGETSSPVAELALPAEVVARNLGAAYFSVDDGRWSTTGPDLPEHLRGLVAPPIVVSAAPVDGTRPAAPAPAGSTGLELADVVPVETESIDVVPVDAVLADVVPADGGAVDPPLVDAVPAGPDRLRATGSCRPPANVRITESSTRDAVGGSARPLDTSVLPASARPVSAGPAAPAPPHPPTRGRGEDTRRPGRHRRSTPAG